MSEHHKDPVKAASEVLNVQTQTTNKDDVEESHQPPTADSQETPVIPPNQASANTDAPAPQQRVDEESEPCQQMTKFIEAATTEKPVSSPESNIANEDLNPEMSEHHEYPVKAASEALNVQTPTTNKDDVEESHQPPTANSQETPSKLASADTDASALQQIVDEESEPCRQMTEFIEAATTEKAVPSPKATEDPIPEVRKHLEQHISAAVEALGSSITRSEKADYENTQQQPVADRQETTEVSQTQPRLETDALPLQLRGETESNTSQQMTELKEDATLDDEVPIAELNTEPEETGTDVSVSQGAIMRTAAAPELPPSVTDKDDNEESQDRPIADFEKSTEMPPLQSSADSVASVLQPMVGKETCPSQQMTELKETATNEEEVINAESNMASEVSDKETGLGQQMAESSRSGLTSPASIPPNGELQTEESRSAAAADQQLAQENSPMVQSSTSVHTSTTHQHHTGQINDERVNASVHQVRLRVQMPGVNWMFDDFLVDLTGMIQSPDELNTMKRKFYSEFHKKGDGEIESTWDLLIQLKQRLLINANDIVYLQAILLKLNRPELLERTLKYRELVGNVLAFNAVEGTPENGYNFVKVHLYLDKPYTQDDISQLKIWMARILCCPDSFAHIVAVEPSRSLLVTFMLPEMYVNILAKYLGTGRLHDKFAALGIDTITIDENVYTIKGCKTPATTGSDEQLISLYDQLSSKDIQLEGMVDTCFQLRQKIEALETEKAGKTAQLEESEKKRKQLMEEIEMLENNVESKVLLVAESEKMCKQLENNMEKLEKQLSNSKAQTLEKQNECKQQEDMIETLERRCNKLGTKLEKLEKETRALDVVSGSNSIQKETENLNDKIKRNEEDTQRIKKKLLTIQDWNQNYITSVADTVTELESEINEYGETGPTNTSETQRAIDALACLSVLWIQKARVLHAELNNFIDEHASTGDSNHDPTRSERVTKCMMAEEG